MKKYIKPHIIYLTWSLLILLFWFVVIPIADYGHSGGEQVIMTLLAYSLKPIILGYFTISILTTLLFRSWFRKYWFVNVMIFSITTYLLIISII
jgi:hypothetical protein